MAADPFYCKHCERQSFIETTPAWTGDVVIRCKGCGWQHFRQFEAGIAVSCEAPTSTPRRVEA